MRSFRSGLVSHPHPILVARLQCFVERDRQGLNRLHPVYRLFLSDGK